MFKSEDIIGDIVFISFNNNECLSEIGIQSSSGHYLVKGLDHLGIWVQHPGIFIKKTTDSNGNPIPLDIQTEDKVDGVFLVAWNFINTIMHYPDRDGYDFPSEFDKEVGFKTKKRLIMLTGKIKVWNRDNGWGFIEGDDGEDYFLNAKNIRAGQSISTGTKVKFDTEESQRGPQAVNVSIY